MKVIHHKDFDFDSSLLTISVAHPIKNNIKNKIDELKSDTLGAVYKTVAFVVVKSNLALVKPCIY